MFKNITKTLLLNKKNFDHIEGKRFYYSPQTTWLTAIFLFAWLVLSVYFIIVESEDILLGIICFCAFFYLLSNMLHKVIFKNPIFIINGSQLFYTKNEMWYDLTKCEVDEEFIGRYNYYKTLTVKTKERDNSFKESYWYIEYDNDLKRAMKKYWDK